MQPCMIQKLKEKKCNSCRMLSALQSSVFCISNTPTLATYAVKGPHQLSSRIGAALFSIQGQHSALFTPALSPVSLMPMAFRIPSHSNLTPSWGSRAVTLQQLCFPIENYYFFLNHTFSEAKEIQICGCIPNLNKNWAFLCYCSITKGLSYWPPEKLIVLWTERYTIARACRSSLFTSYLLLTGWLDSPSHAKSRHAQSSNQPGSLRPICGSSFHAWQFVSQKEKQTYFIQACDWSFRVLDNIL